jgi:hypothetical protein
MQYYDMLGLKKLGISLGNGESTENSARIGGAEAFERLAAGPQLA